LRESDRGRDMQGSFEREMLVSFERERYRERDARLL